jgi:alpha-tubulin suppressor-like RCC1 family protein
MKWSAIAESLRNTPINEYNDFQNNFKDQDLNIWTSDGTKNWESDLLLNEDGSVFHNGKSTVHNKINAESWKEACSKRLPDIKCSPLKNSPQND